MFPRRSASQPAVRRDPRLYRESQTPTLLSSIPLGLGSEQCVSFDRTQTSEPVALPQLPHLARAGTRDHVSTILLTQKLPGPQRQLTSLHGLGSFVGN